MIICSISTSALKRMIDVFKPMVSYPYLGNKSYSRVLMKTRTTDTSTSSMTLTAFNGRDVIVWNADTTPKESNEACVYADATIVINFYRFCKNVNASILKMSDSCDISIENERGIVVWKIGLWSYVEDDTMSADSFQDALSALSLSTPDEEGIEEEKVDLRAVLKACAYATAKTDKHRCFQSIARTGDGVFVSTDGHRLAMYEGHKRGNGNGDGNGTTHIIPSGKGVEYGLDKIPFGEVWMSHLRDRTVIRSLSRSVAINIKDIDDTYPDFSRVIPWDRDCVIELEAQAAANMKNSISSLSKKTIPVFCHNYKTRTTWISASKDNACVDNAIMMIDAKESGDWSKGLERDVIGINAFYLLDAINAVSVNNPIQIQIHSLNDAFVIKGGEESTTSILMGIDIP